MIALVILWVICAVGAYLIAAHKHNHPGRAFASGLLLGPFGLIAVATWKNDPDAQQ
jgi:hypothetical protein